MRIGSAGNYAETFRSQGFSEHLGVSYDLFRIVMKAGLHGFEETNRFGRDNVHQRPTLHSGKYSFVDRSGEFLFAKNHAGAGATQSLMRCGGNDMGMRHRRWMRATRHQSGEVGHVDEIK